MGPYRRLSILICLVLECCASQSTSTASCITCSPSPICEGCNVNIDIITTSSTSWYYANPVIPTPFLYPYLHFTAYSVTSTSSEAGTCAKHTGSPVPLVDPYVVSVPTTWALPIPETVIFQDSVSYSASYTAYYSTFLDDAYSSLNTILGYECCTAALPSSVLLSLLATSGILYLPDVASETGLSLATETEVGSAAATATESSVPFHHIHKTQIIIVSVVVPTVGLVTFLLCFTVLRRYRRKRSQAAIKNQSGMTSNTQLYVDRKAELEDEERRKFELDAGGITYEMEGEDRIFEMPASDKGTETRLASLRETHEMRGVEHSQELEVLGSAT